MCYNNNNNSEVNIRRCQYDCACDPVVREKKYDCRKTRQVIKHKHIVNHQHDIINEYEIIHEHDYNYYDVIKESDVVRHHDFTDHDSDYCCEYQSFGRAVSVDGIVSGDGDVNVNNNGNINGNNHKCKVNRNGRRRFK